MKSIISLSLVIGIFWAPGMATASEVMIAVAANFTAPMKAIIARFEQATGHRVRVSYGATGKFYAQIRNGAPFEALLAADQRRPALLDSEGVGVPGSRFTYATGTLVLWSAQPDKVGDGPELLEAGAFNKLSLANPKLAPYGEAAIQTLEALGLRDQLEPKFVMGENIAQTFQFVDTGNADLGFVALSQVMRDGEIRKGSGWVVPAELHEPIRQDAVVLKKGEHNAALQALMAYLQSDATRTLIQSYGYATD